MSRTEPLTAPLPELDDFTIDRVREYLLEKFYTKRPPDVMARLLAFIIDLHEQNRPYPARHIVAEHLNASPFGLDAAINRAMGAGLVKIAINPVEGRAVQRANVVLQKRYIPSRALLEAAKKPAHSRR